MVLFKENRKFFEFAIGYIFVGIGQKLMGVGLLKTWSENAPVLLWLGLVGLSLFGIGLFFIGKLAIWFLREFNQEQRVAKVVGLALAVSMIGGLLLGGLGQLIYDYSSFGYQEVKNAIWLVTSLFQTFIKVTVIFNLYCFYKDSNFSWKKENFRRIIAIVLLGILIAVNIGLIWSAISDILLGLTDMIVILGTVYYLLEK
ncbi:hypothetical protein [Streptococcus sp. 2022WUSS135]|uniref:hypothetical protein n=1 Tax=Streptococcus sp. 2022WUSS135 TaxID=2983288 RepID=UPI0020040872|nr:hypothetical protein [Streptococcus suis]